MYGLSMLTGGVILAVMIIPITSSISKEAIQTGIDDTSKAAVIDAISHLDKAAEKGIIHKNNAARRKGRLMRHLAKMDKPSA